MDVQEMTPDTVRQMLAPPDASKKAAELVPATPTSTAMAQFATNPEALVCRDMLSDADKARAQAEAQQIVPEMIDNINVLMTYGSDAVDGLNRLVDKALREEDIEVPEVREFMKKMNDRMRSIKRNYDPSDPEIRFKYEKAKKKILGIFGDTRSFLEMLGEDVRNVSTQLDRDAVKVREDAEGVMKDANLFAELLKAEDEATYNLIYKIAVMEYSVIGVHTEAQTLHPDPSNMADPDARRLRALTMLEASLTRKVGDYQARLWYAWVATPNMSNQLQVDFDLALRLYYLADVVVPQMKELLLLWTRLAKAIKAAKMGEVIREGSNEFAQEYAAAASTGIPEVEQAAQAPILMTETIDAMLSSVQAQTDGILAALQAGSDARLKVAQAITAGKHELDASQVKLNAGIIEIAAKEAGILTSSNPTQD